MMKQKNAVTVTEVSGTLTSGLDLYQDRLIVRNDNGGNVTNADLDTANDSADTDITDVFTNAGSDITILDGFELFIPSTETYDPGGDVTGDDFDINGTFDIDADVVTVSGSWDTTSGDFTVTGTIIFDATTSETIISNNKAFDHIQFNGVGGTWVLEDILDINGDITITNGTVDVNVAEDNTITLDGDFRNAGTFTARNGNVSLTGTDQSLTGAITFYDITKSAITVGTLTFEAGQIYDY